MGLLLLSPPTRENHQPFPEASRDHTDLDQEPLLLETSENSRNLPSSSLETSFPETRQRNRQRLQERPQIPVICRPCPSRSRWGLHGRSFRRYQPLCHPRQESYHRAKGHATRQKNQR